VGQHALEHGGDRARTDPVARRQRVDVGGVFIEQLGPRRDPLGLAEHREGDRREPGVDRQRPFGAASHRDRPGVDAEHLADQLAALDVGGVELFEPAQHRDQPVEARAEQCGAQRGT